MNKRTCLTLLSALLALVAPAQDVDWSQWGILPEEPLITSADQLESLYSDEAEGLHIEYLTDGDINTFWHSDWHGRVSGTPSVDIALADDTEGYVALYIGRRNSSGTCQFTNMELQASPDGQAWTSCGTAVMEYKSQNEYVPSIPFYLPQGTRHLRLLCVGRSNTVGAINDCGIGTFHMGELQIYRVDEIFGREYDLNAVLLKYDEYIGGATNLDMGEGLGQYSDFEAEKAFVDGLTLCSEILAAGTAGEYSNAQVRDIVRGIEDSYEAVLASEVPYQLPADGYYRIHCDTYYYVEKETGEIDLDGNPVVERTEMPKAFYATLEGKIRWGDVANGDCRFVWHLQRQADNSIVMLNAATGERVANMNGSGAVVMAAESDTTVMFDYATTRDDRVLFCIRFKGQPKDMSGNTNKYFHQWYHNSGTGTGGEVCYWYPTYNLTDGGRGTSEYYLEAVPEAEAQALIDEYAVIKDRAKMITAYEDMIENAKVAIAKAKAGAHTALTDQPFITQAEQLHSLWSDPDEGKDLGALIDGDAGTFWHSTWHGSSYDYPFHSLDVALAEPLEGAMMALIQRRSTAADDHITRLEIYGTNEAALLDAPGVEGWTTVAREVQAPWYDGQGEVSTPVFALPQPLQYLRFVVSNTTGRNNLGMRTFFHMSGFQLYPVEKSGNCQYDYLAEAGDALQKFVDASYTFDHENELTVEYYNQLKAAYDAFVPNVIDPTPLSDAISRRMNDANVVEVGEHPGFWPDDHATNYLAETIEGARQYLSGAYYTPESMQEWIDRVNQAGDNILKSVIPVSTDKWYRIRFGTAEEYEAHQWNTSSASTSDGSVNVFGMVFAPGRYVEATELTPGHTEIIPHEDIREGVNLSFINPDMLDNDAYAIWRFVDMGGGKYAIQQKYTGLYIQRDRYHGESIHLDVMPTMMDIRPQGHGQVAFVMQDLAGFSWEKNFINTWRDHYQLISWNSAGAGTNSAFYIEEVDDIDPEEEPGFFYRDVNPGGVYGLCYPMSVAMDGGMMYTVAGTFETSEGQFVALNEIEEAEPAQPFIYVANGEYDAEATVPVGMTLGSFIETEPKKENGLKAHFTPQFIDPGYVVFADGKPQARNGKNANVVSNEAYLTYGSVPITEDDEYDLALLIDGTIANGIRPALSKLAAPAAVYDLSGRQVMASGTLSDVRRLAPGTYVVGGVKVRVR